MVKNSSFDFNNTFFEGEHTEVVYRLTKNASPGSD